MQIVMPQADQSSTHSRFRSHVRGVCFHFRRHAQRTSPSTTLASMCWTRVRRRRHSRASRHQGACPRRTSTPSWVRRNQNSRRTWRRSDVLRAFSRGTRTSTRFRHTCARRSARDGRADVSSCRHSRRTTRRRRGSRRGSSTELRRRLSSALFRWTRRSSPQRIDSRRSSVISPRTTMLQGPPRMLPTRHGVSG